MLQLTQDFTLLFPDKEDGLFLSWKSFQKKLVLLAEEEVKDEKGLEYLSALKENPSEGNASDIRYGYYVLLNGDVLTILILFQILKFSFPASSLLASVNHLQELPIRFQKNRGRLPFMIPEMHSYCMSR